MQILLNIGNILNNTHLKFLIRLSNENDIKIFNTVTVGDYFLKQWSFLKVKKAAYI